MLSQLVCGLCCLLMMDVALGATSPKSIVAARVSSTIHIDGILSEDDWKAASPATHFLQFDPEEGATATESTVVRVLYDDNALYVGVLCLDSDPNGIAQQLTRRDRRPQADRFQVMIDSYHDHSTAFLFGGTVSGVQADGILSQDGRVYDDQWDAVWDFDAAIVPGGWSGEFRIPFSALRFASQDTDYVWGINFRRYIARKQEIDEWVMVPRNEVPAGTISSVSKMGHLIGMKNINPPLHLELLPYGVSRVNSLAQPAPFSTTRELKGSAGLDLKYGVTNNYTLDLALNPDFGQVEVDQAVLNLTVFETFYPEKRPLFLEGAQLFSFGNMIDNQELRLFYSRRIGRRPTLQPSLSPGFHFVDNPQTTTILGAAKFTGRSDGGLALAALSAVTDREEAVEEDTAGVRSGPIMVEPRASYNVLRMKQDILDHSYVGMMATSSFREQGLPSLSGGLDWNVQIDNGAYGVEGYVAGSQISPLPGSRQSGGAGRIGLEKPQGDHWWAFSFYDFSTRNFFIDDVGFFSQPREHGGYSEILYKEDHASEPIRRYSVAAQSDYRWNWDRINTVKDLELNITFEFRNFWLFGTDYYHDLPAYDDANRGIVGIYRRPSRDRLILTLQSDSRGAFVLSLNPGYYASPKGLSTLFSILGLTIRPNSWIEFNPSITVVRTRNEEAWAIPYFTDDLLNLFGDRDIDEYDFSLRGTVTFTPHLSIQFFTQVFLAKGGYSNFRKLASPTDFVPYDYLHSASYASQGSPDFNEKTLNANFVLRWEYLPGSTLYLVWTQTRYGNSGIYDTRLSRNFSDAFRLPMDNVFLAKATYWFSF